MAGAGDMALPPLKTPVWAKSKGTPEKGTPEQGREDEAQIDLQAWKQGLTAKVERQLYTLR